MSLARNVEQRFYDNAVTKRYAKNGGLKKQIFLMKPMILIYNDDNPEMHRQIYDYATTLTFWRTLEEKYRERKRKWLAARADPNYIHKPLRRECTILKTTVPLEIDVKEPDASFSTVTDDYIDASAANDKEFSDVDSELFTDPGDVRHRLLIFFLIKC